MIQLVNHRLERALRREGPDMQFVDHRPGQRRRRPVRIRPEEFAVVNGAGKTVNAVRLPG